MMVIVVQALALEQKYDDTCVTFIPNSVTFFCFVLLININVFDRNFLLQPPSKLPQAL